ncbi:MAG TPA: hypothetical protein VGD88_09275 [Opitutaceae bacterium]
MSLINEALKKAQRMRAETPPPAAAPGPDGTPAPVVIRRGRPVPAQVIVLSILGGAVLIGAAVVITLLMLRPDAPVTPSPTPAKAAPVATSTPSEPSATPVVIALPPVGPVLPTTASTPAPEKQVAPPPAVTTAKAPAPTSSPSATTPVSTAPAATTTVAASPVATPSTEPSAATPAASAGPAKPDIRVQEFIDRLRVSGIRASPTDPRVSMNDRVFKLNDVVDRTLGLRIIAIEAAGLTFVDAAGVVYTKNF